LSADALVKTLRVRHAACEQKQNITLALSLKITIHMLLALEKGRNKRHRFQSGGVCCGCFEGVRVFGRNIMVRKLRKGHWLAELENEIRNIAAKQAVRRQHA